MAVDSNRVEKRRTYMTHVRQTTTTQFDIYLRAKNWQTPPATAVNRATPNRISQERFVFSLHRCWTRCNKQFLSTERNLWKYCQTETHQEECRIKRLCCKCLRRAVNNINLFPNEIKIIFSFLSVAQLILFGRQKGTEKYFGRMPRRNKVTLWGIKSESTIWEKQTFSTHSQTIERD